jgi:DNA-binding NarL/FixJ family response regulator
MAPTTLTRIVAADNQHLFLSALADLLREQPGWEVVAEAASGREAVECCRRFKPDLIVMDVRMTEVDGVEATQAIKRESPKTAVVVLNGYGDPDTLAQAVEAGAVGYILKSATPQEITGAIRKALEGAFPLDQEIAALLLFRLLGNPQKERLSPLGRKQQIDEDGAAVALPASLTQREVEVLRLIARGYTNREIARDLLISVSTVKKHVRSLLSKLEASDRTQAAVRANGLHLLDDPRKGSAAPP